MDGLGREGGAEFCGDPVSVPEVPPLSDRTAWFYPFQVDEHGLAQ